MRLTMLLKHFTSITFSQLRATQLVQYFLRTYTSLRGPILCYTAVFRATKTAWPSLFLFVPKTSLWIPRFAAIMHVWPKYIPNFQSCAIMLLYNFEHVHNCRSCHVLSMHERSCHVLSVNKRSCYILSVHVQSCYVLYVDVQSCYVLSVHVRSCYLLYVNVRSCNVLFVHGKSCCYGISVHV